MAENNEEQTSVIKTTEPGPWFLGAAVWVTKVGDPVQHLAEIVAVKSDIIPLYKCRIVGERTSKWFTAARLRVADPSALEEAKRRETAARAEWLVAHTEHLLKELVNNNRPNLAHAYAALPRIDKDPDLSLGTSVEKKPEPRPCLVCPNMIPAPHPGSTFCSSQCSEAAAKALKPADRALRFLCGLNLQDHSIKEQRELLEIVHQLKGALELARHRRGGR
jgi:hypothetical protein